MTNVTESVKAGGTIAAPLMDSSVFPSMVCHMVKVGEETGALTTMLSKIGDFLRGPGVRRRHRHRDVPAAVQHLRPDQVAAQSAPRSMREQLDSVAVGVGDLDADEGAVVLPFGLGDPRRP